MWNKITPLSPCIAWYFDRKVFCCICVSKLLTVLIQQPNSLPASTSILSISYLQDTCRMAAPEFRYGLEVQQTSVQKQTHLLRPFPFQFSLETINCLCHHRIIIEHIPLGHHSMREELLFNILVAPTFNQLLCMSPGSSCSSLTTFRNTLMSI